MEEQIKEWRADQKKLTREILERVDIVSFSFDLSGNNKGCTLDHLDGRYGYVKLQDALDRTWRVYDYDTDVLQKEYDTIDALVAGGWKVST